MRKISNPFITSGYVTEEYFCDREAESLSLIKTITNGNNLAIISPRRMGKTGLIQHCFHKEEIVQNYHYFFIDIYATTNLKEFVYKLGKEIFETLKPKDRKFIDNFFSIISSLRPAFKLDPASGAATFDIGIGEIHQAQHTLDEIFRYLETADTPCLVAIDEFQQIANYPEKNIEAILRTHIQHCKNTSFIFAGSQRHIMQNIFFSSSRPFYQSVSLLQLDSIPEETYVDFVKRHFKNGNKVISDEIIHVIYQLFEGHTWYIQNIFNELYALTDENTSSTLELTQQAVENRIASYEPVFQSTLRLLPERQKEVIYAIAKERKATGITSTNFIKKHHLQSSSSVQTSIKQLLEKEILTVENNTYQIYDRFFGLWLTTVFGNGYQIE
jgi:AAA+ ATPase superfamily predicted ATPase